MNKEIIVATWNIREFDSAKYGNRSAECLHYIAEIISHFDLVAIQEVRDDMRAFNRVMSLLGSWWKSIFTDVTEGHSGNRERIAFVYDSRKLSFGGLAGEIVLPPDQRPRDGAGNDQFSRTPFLLGFKAGWFKFTICSTHLYYGKSVADDPRRLEEMKALSSFLADRVKEQYAFAKNMIVLGDFNIFQVTDKTFEALTSAGFKVPTSLMAFNSNKVGDKHFDQIAFISPDQQDRLEEAASGVFNYYHYVYRDGRDGGESDEGVYAEAMGDKYKNESDAAKRTRYYRDWITYQMSDHLPMWIALKTDFGAEYLKRKSVPPTS